MNGYELSRAWFDFSFDNPEKIKPSHSAVYFVAIEHCNRLGWKEKFGFPSQMVMEAIGIKNWRTYSGVLKDLVEFGFIEMIETSKNQYSANIVAIVKNTKAPTKALDKALQKHDTKHSQSTVSINKQDNKEQGTKNKRPTDYPFELFWEMYDKKTGKPKCESKYEKLSEEIRKTIFEHVLKYKESQPDKQFRKNPDTYLNQQSWNDEIVSNTPPKPQQRQIGDFL